MVADSATAIARPSGAHISGALPTITAVAAFPCGMKSHGPNDPHDQNVATPEGRSERAVGANSAKVRVTDDSVWHGEEGLTGWEELPLATLRRKSHQS